MNFIIGLPKFKDLIINKVVVNCFSRYATFILVPQYANKIVQIFLKHIDIYWSIPQDIVSDRDLHFINKFWTKHFKIYGLKLSTSSLVYPKSNGKIEWFSNIVEKYL